MEAINLSIASPCHQNWDKMDSSTQGRFCNSCEKQVVDFTTMTDGEVLSFLKLNASKSMCGRMAADQVSRPIYKNPLTKNKKWYWPAVAFFFLMFGKSSKAQNITGEIAVTEQPAKKNIQEPFPVEAVGLMEKAISVKVLNKDGVGIAGAVIELKNSGKTFATGKDGTVAFLITDKDLSFTVKNPGSVTREVFINKKMHYVLEMKSTEVKSNPDPIIMGMISVRKTGQVL